MLKSIQGKNFQSHENTTVEFVPGINLLVGTTNSGKTAILRMLKWVMKNRPLGEGFIRRGTSETSVDTVWEIGDKTIEVGRSRGKSHNKYTLTGHEDFTSPGNTPPQQVLDAINLSDINVQDQFSPYFLVFETPGFTAEYIRKITGLTEIDKVADDLASKLRKNNGEMAGKEADLKEINDQLRELEEIPIDNFEKLLIKFEKLSDDVAIGQQIQQELEKLCERIRELEAQRIELSEEQYQKIQQKLSSTVKSYEKNVLEHDSLNQIVNRWIEVEADKIELVSDEKLVELNLKIEKVSKQCLYDRLERDGLENLISTLEALEESRVEVSVTIEFGEELIVGYINSCDELLEIHNFIEEAQEIHVDLDDLKYEIGVFQKEEKALQEQLEVCPACGTELTEKSRQVLLEEKC